MIGHRTLRQCTTCLARQNIVYIPRSKASCVSSSSRSRLISNTSSSRSYHLESSRVDTSAFELPGSSHHTTLETNRPNDFEEEVEEEWQPREERRSPAALFGSKRIGLEVIPPTLEERIQAEIDEHHPRDIREAFLTLLEPQEKKKSRTKKKYDDNGAVLAVAKAATILPGDYAVMSNVMREIRGRLGGDWLDRESGGVLEMSSGYGPGLLALREGQTIEKEMKLVHTNRHGLELSKRLFTSAQSALEGDFEARASESIGAMSFERKLAPTHIHKTFLAMSTFYLSTLPTAASRQVHLRQLLSLSPSYLILVDRSSPTGWQAISEAREYILSLSDSDTPWHLIAPCPHEHACPLAGGKDRCSFSQKLQRPSFTQKTKHASRGEEDVNYTYLVIGRGPGPRPTGSLNLGFSETGRLGGVGKEDLERQAMKVEGKSELREVEGGEFEMVSLASPKAEGAQNVPDSNADEVNLRSEAYSWPRIVAPPMKRAGHVILDTCYPDGNIQRLTYAKSHSKQVYYDARKTAWGDLFPHESKSKLVRKRGVRKLVKAEGFDGFGLEDGDDPLLAMGDLPVGELEAASESAEGQGDGEVISWKSGHPAATRGATGQRRSMSTSARRPVISSPRTASQLRHMSARPESQSNGHLPALRPKVTLNTLRSLAAENTPITCLTAYDFPTALLSETAGIDMVLVGDSLSQVALGHTSTTQVTLDEMIHHAKAVTRGAKSPFVFADMPFGSFESSVEMGVSNVVRMIKEAGVDGVKIEGGREIVPLVKRLNDIGIPVIPHIGLQPQRATSLSGYLVQGKTTTAALDLYDTARELREAGATGFLLEAIPHRLAKYISDTLDTLTIGIGAGADTHGQVLVITDVLGLYDGEGANKPRFVRHFGQVGKAMREAVEDYKLAVGGKEFPELGKETYTMKKEEWEGFLNARAQRDGQ